MANYVCMYICKVIFLKTILQLLAGFIPENHVFLCNARLSRHAYPYVVDWPVDRQYLADKIRSLVG